MKKRLWIPCLLIVAALACRDFWPSPAHAATSTVCAGNICSGTATVTGPGGSVVVAYSWTENHNATDSSLKFRFKAGPFVADAVHPVNFSITVGQAFASNTSLKNPIPTMSLPADQTVNGPKTNVVRSEATAIAGKTYDFVQELRYGPIPPGTLLVTLQFDAYGGSTPVSSFNVYFDAVSPSNRDEGQSLAALYGVGYRQCYDVPSPGPSIDNDLDYRTDCADTDCTGQSIGATSVCEVTETTCNDGLDNSGDGKVDCADPLCNGKVGNSVGPKYCGPENGGALRINCADGFDNDGNSKIDCVDDAPGTGCWKGGAGYQDCAKTETSCTDSIDNDRDRDYASTIDAAPGTGVDCRDYDCKGLGNCTVNEKQGYDAGSGTFIDKVDQCFDGLDNDLDGVNDCSDSDCLGVTKPGPPIQRCAGFEAYLPPSPLGSGDPFPKFYFNYCADGVNNDGDAGTDATDSDCKNVFGQCGPSPAIEDYTFLSCSDAKDNDLNTKIDCADAACRANGKVARTGCLDATCGAPAKYALTQTDVAVCAATEASANVCGDGIDNDGNAIIDCAEASCNGVRHGPTVGTVGAQYTCGTESGAPSCRDGADNDSDAGTDCFDTACQDGTQCKRRPGTGGWTSITGCPTVPHTTALAPIATGGAVQFAHDDALYVNAAYKLRLKGSGSYSSLTVVIGDAAVPANAFPFNASTLNCTLGGSGSLSMQYSNPAVGVGVINEIAGSTLTDFDVTLTCASSSAVPMGPQSYKLSVVANHAGAVEFGESTLTVQVYENTAPTVPNPAIETEGIIGSFVNGTVNVPAGANVRFQAVMNPAYDPSGICRCDFTLNGAAVSSTDGNCRVTAGPFANDNAAYPIRVKAVDGAANVSANSNIQNIKINVVPSVSENLTLGGGPLAYTYRGNDVFNLAVRYQTDTVSTFPLGSNCRVYVYDKTWAGSGLPAPTASMVTTVSPPGSNNLICQGTYTVPPALAAGRYWIFVEGTDSTGDIVRSNAQTFLKCENGDLGTGDCKDADFDRDGTPEGRYTPSAATSPTGPTYPGGAQPHACDNCINFVNQNQADTNANGVGDACEASAVGRCQYKYCGSAPNDPTPGGACTSDAQCAPPDFCIVVDQPMCTINCGVDLDCGPPNSILSGVCKPDWGACDAPGGDTGNCCFSNSDCLSGTCKALVKPFIQTMSGQIYSAGQIQAAEAPPGTVTNATYCLQSNGAITNFSSEKGCSLSGSPTYQMPLPNADGDYVGSFGSIDVKGILGGKYGALNQPAQPPAQLGGGIYYFPSGLTISSAITFLDSGGAVRANGLVIVKGDLNINADLAYQNQSQLDLKNLASVGWIVLKDSPTTGGNVKIAGGVNKIVGAFYAENSIDTGNGTSPLDAVGSFVSRNFSFNRQYASRTAGSERVTFDARLVLNPPPGLADAARSLPGFKSIPGQ